MATIRDVAARAGVSISTVSFVLNGKAKEKKVAASTCEKVMEAANTLGYKPSSAARILRSSEQEKPVIALYWPRDYRTGYLSVVLNSVRDEIERQNLDCTLTIHTYRNDYLYEEKELTDRYQYDAAVIGAASPADLQYLDTLDPALPLILFNRASSVHHSITAGNDAAVDSLTALLASKGLTEMALLRTESSYVAYENRLHSLQQSCSRYRIRIREDAVWDVEDSYAGGILAAENYLALEKRPPFIFSMTDTIALGASYVFAHEGLLIPRDVQTAAFGLGDPNTARYAVPSLSVIELPSSEMAKAAVSTAAKMIRSPGDAEKTRLQIPAQLRLRESCPEI